MYIKARVTPNSTKETFEQTSEDSFKISVKEKAERNMANVKVIELLAHHFKVPPKNLRIINGHHSRSKLLSLSENKS